MSAPDRPRRVGVTKAGNSSFRGAQRRGIWPRAQRTLRDGQKTSPNRGQMPRCARHDEGAHYLDAHPPPPRAGSACGPSAEGPHPFAPPAFPLNSLSLQSRITDRPPPGLPLDPRKSWRNHHEKTLANAKSCLTISVIERRAARTGFPPGLSAPRSVFFCALPQPKPGDVPPARKTIFPNPRPAGVPPARKTARQAPPA